MFKPYDDWIARHFNKDPFNQNQRLWSRGVRGTLEVSFESVYNSMKNWRKNNPNQEIVCNGHTIKPGDLVAIVTKRGYVSCGIYMSQRDGYAYQYATLSFTPINSNMVKDIKYMIGRYVTELSYPVFPFKFDKIKQKDYKKYYAHLSKRFSYSVSFIAPLSPSFNRQMDPLVKKAQEYIRTTHTILSLK